MRAAAEVLLWWSGLTGLWLVTLSVVSVPELVAAAGCAFLSALAARAARRAMNGAWRPRAAWARWFLAVPAAALRESVRVLAVVVRTPAAGRFDEVVVPDEPGDVADARLAIATVVIGCAPGTMVVATPPGDHRVIVHRLLDDPSPSTEQVTR